jgi:hypothetical protein
MSESPEVAIYVTVTTEYSWTGPVSDLPPGLRKGVVVKGEVDLDRLGENFENVDQAVAQKFFEKHGDVDSDTFEVTNTEEA